MSNQSIPPFLNKTYDIVNDPHTDDIVSWGPSGESFIVWKQGDFADQLLPRHFKHSNFSSFVRQLNTYGFKKVDPDKWEFSNEYFLRGQKELLHGISRRKNGGSAIQSQQNPGQLSQIPALELGRYGGLADELDNLKRDRVLLVEELRRQRQRQQESDLEMRGLQLRVENMERQHHRTMSFLSKALQNPSFLQQILQAHGAGHITGRKTKVRRVSTFDRESDTESPAEDSAVDNTNAIMPYQDPTEFTHYLTDILDAEPGPQNWPTRTGPPEGFRDVNSAFTEMKLASRGATDNLSQMPAIPVASNSMIPNVIVESDSPTIRQLPNGLQLKDMPEQVETTGADGHPSSSQRANPDDSIGAPETAARQMSGVQQNGMPESSGWEQEDDLPPNFMSDLNFDLDNLAPQDLTTGEDSHLLDNLFWQDCLSSIENGGPEGSNGLHYAQKGFGEA